MKALIYVATIICLLIFSTNSNAQSGSGLYFSNPVLESGAPNADGAVYRFSNVTTGVDALVTINGRSDNLVNVLNFDMNSSGFDAAFQPQVGYNNGTAPGPADWWMEFAVRFVEAGTSTPATLIEFNVSGVDIDGNGQYINEYLSFYRMETYSFEANSGLTLTTITETVGDSTYNIGKRFDGPTANYANIDTSATVVMVSNKYVNTDHFVFRAGGRSTGVSGASDRMYSLYFREFNYNAPYQITLAQKAKVKKTPVAKTDAKAHVYPNPFQNRLEVVLPASLSNRNVTIEVVDMSGRTISSNRYSGNGKAQTLFLSHLKRGMYAVRMTSETTTTIQLVAKN